MLTAANVVPTIKKLVESYLEEAGSTDLEQNETIFMYLTQALRELAHLAYHEKTSDALYISSDGDAIFQRSGQDITDMYSPNYIINPDGDQTRNRVSYTDKTGGWWRESSNTNIHFNGFNLPERPLKAGEYILHYLAYPASINSLNSPINFPDAGSLGLCYYTAGLIYESLPTAKDLVSHYYALANSHLKIAVQANIAARKGYVPSLNAVDQLFGG